MDDLQTEISLYEKYDVPIPRYTSYPTVPYWESKPEPEEWLESVREALSKPQSRWSLYIHIPYCETRCTFCACNTIISPGHAPEKPYMDLLAKEFDFYLKHVEALGQNELSELHLGGGTPTFLSAANLEFLVSTLLARVQKSKNWIGSVEVDPRQTQREQLAVLRRQGFNRISLGVQDFNLEVQTLLNRIQPYEQTQKITNWARQLGYVSVNFDLIYGLPRQSLEKMKLTIEKTLTLRPDRIALYSLALVPWLKPSQKLFKEEDLPQPQAKRQLYEYSRNALLSAGYLEIGMDHFALAHDDLALAQKNGQLHRNFMGYTPSKMELLLGLGVSSISETDGHFHQNYKELSLYQEQVIHKKLPTFKGHRLTAQDKRYRDLILEFMTQRTVRLPSQNVVRNTKEFLGEMIKDGLVEFSRDRVRLTEKGRPFLRNACMSLDQRLRSRHSGQQAFVFSKAV